VYNCICLYFTLIELGCMAMTGFNLYIGNRMKVRAEQLADVLREPLGDPLKSEIVIAQN
jgi:hypothetical protein